MNKSKRIAYINIGNFGSTGKIVNGLAELAKNKGYEVLKCYPDLDINFPTKNDDYIISSNFFRKINNALSVVTGLPGKFAYFSTLKLIKKIKEFNPDIIHLHNIHSGFLNYKLLFDYLHEYRGKIIWTLHDCWSFTGRCPHFELVQCEKWKTMCQKCPFGKSLYPQTIFDYSKSMWRFKKKNFTGIKNLVLVTPSKWLAKYVEESFLKNYELVVINNGIDLNIFKPYISDYRKQFIAESRCSDVQKEKFIILGVAFGWNERKGLDVFIELAKRLPEQFVIVMVGTNDKIDLQLPKRIISIHRTENQIELAKIYSSCDLFVNPTREDNYPTVNMEAIACGTPVLTFETGGAAEIIDSVSGRSVSKNDIDALVSNILDCYENRRLKKEDCLKKALDFKNEDKYSKYIELYNKGD